MKKILIPLIILVVLVGGIGAATWTFGTLTEEGVTSYFEEVDEQMPSRIMNVSLPDYQRGFLRSSGTTRVSVTPDEEEITISMKHEIYHGPLAVTPDGIKAGTSYIITTLNPEPLPAEAREKIARIWGEKEPFVVRTRVDFAGTQHSDLEIGVLDYRDDEVTTRFGGATGTMKVTTDQDAFDATLEISESRIRVKSEGPESVKVRIEPSRFTVSFEKGSHLVAEGSAGSFRIDGLTSEGESLWFESEGMTLAIDQTALPDHEDLMVGESKITMPGAAGSFGAPESLELGEFVVSSTASEEKGLITTEVNYSLASIDGLPLPDDEEAPSLIPPALLESVSGGVGLGLTATLPVRIAEDLARFSEEFNTAALDTENSEMTPEQREKLGEILESSLRGIARGTGFGLSLAVGGGANQAKADLALDYVGEKPLTSTKTYGEIANNSRLEISVSFPESLLGSDPAMAEQKQLLLASGTFKQNGDKLESVSILKDGILLSNGEPNPLFLQMVAPMMQAPIDWNAIFVGIQEAASAGE